MTTDTTTGTKLVQPYLFFNGRCDEALDFYKRAVGAQVGMLMRFDESPDPVPAGMIPAGYGNKVMHCEMRIGGTSIFASDGCAEGAKFEGFSLALTVPTIADADRAFAALADGGKVTMPLAETFWSPRYGMLTDRFGINWMVMVPPAQAKQAA